MSTPATIEINGRIFYCHYDGMPTGMAVRIAKMIDAYNAPVPAQSPDGFASVPARGGIEFAFIRGNLDAEPAPHNSRSGIMAQYHYALAQDDRGEITITVEQRTSRDTWRIVSTMEIGVWVGRQRSALATRERLLVGNPNLDIDAVIPPVVRAHYCGRFASERFEYATRSGAEKLVARNAALAERYGPDNPNHTNCSRAMTAWAKALGAVH